MRTVSNAVRCIAAASMALLAAPCVAQLNTDPATWPAMHDGVKQHPDEVRDLRTTPERDDRPIDPYAYRRGFFSSLGLYEYRKVGEVPGQYNRPHYALGMSSSAMRDVLSLAGLEADKCVAPMVRLRARDSSVTGAGSISMTLLARCTFR
jgi:hypothetical protein